ncbi:MULTISPECIES: NAD-dependent succinate-semialdehyde dehydrogenase [Ramlibacter]|uniref:Aldehyde dehydrogenase family protein n=1 Tax=Ramlibacter pinisoli TaxID=2682844 RepID=A0A6N8J0S4_9BURK|nr:MULTISPECIES: NAD-dependent succinate-semialdehyde dehydrogenase [Ramlibacter]MBA2961920.1 NAD-dependent succinate-semialdehyde dehydrogenase [Ramlibacter sp. CGMCC 1.13660]MVQ31863.1 aldehyde dehydrogenase family protein [Ramlibacter pinisoli]
MITSTNPATGEVIATFDAHDQRQVDAALQGAWTAQKAWRRTTLEERSALLRRVAAVLRDRKPQLARLITLEMGKPIVESEAEIEKSAWNCEYYADHASAVLGDEVVPSGATESRVVYDPLGVVLAIMPWNYPVWQVLRFAAPALAAGNGIVLKHANNVPQCALELEKIFSEAGTPAGLFATVLVEASQVKSLIEDPRIAALTLTGSTPVGKLVASQAGAVLKKQVLELGGSDPFIVLADADLESAARTAVKARFINVGQSCINGKRFIVEAAVADRFTELFVQHASALKIGDPLQRDVAIGPMARANLRDELHSQVERTVRQGAKLLLGGRFCDGPGFFYQPTVLDHVAPDMVAACEETFGPAAAILRVQDAEQAIEVANAPDYGLGAALWTSDLQRAHALSRRIEAGAVFINGMVASDPRLPFGGIKQSGYGRELGVHGAREFTNVKTVWVGPAR